MSNNIQVGPNIVAYILSTPTALSSVVNASNTAVIYLLALGNLYSYQPDRPINGFSELALGTGDAACYWLVALSAFFLPGVVPSTLQSSSSSSSSSASSMGPVSINYAVPDVVYPDGVGMIFQVTQINNNQPAAGTMSVSIGSSSASASLNGQGIAVLTVGGVLPGDNQTVAAMYTPAFGSTTPLLTTVSVLGMSTVLNATPSGDSLVVTGTASMAGTSVLTSPYAASGNTLDSLVYVGQAVAAGVVPTIGVFADSGSLGTTGIQTAMAMVNHLTADYGAIQSYFGSTVPTWPTSAILLGALGTVTGGSGGAFHNADVPGNLTAAAVSAGLACTMQIFFVDADLSDWRTSSALFLAELVELGEWLQNRGWGAIDSNGEGLSRVLPQQVYPGILQGCYRYDVLEAGSSWTYVTSNIWVNLGDPPYSHPLRSDFVTSTALRSVAGTGDQDLQAVGCSVLFIDWLVSLGHSYAAVAQAGCGTGATDILGFPTGTLGQLYNNLTGLSASGAFSTFLSAVDAKWPGSVPGATTNEVTDDNLWVNNPNANPPQWAPNPGSPPALPAVPYSGPSGTVQLYLDGTLHSSLTWSGAGGSSQGSVTFNLASLSGSGSHSYRVHYPGQGLFAPAADVTGTISL